MRVSTIQTHCHTRSAVKICKIQCTKNLYGFTLIELLIALAILGILAAIAYPSYQTQLERSRRADGQVALLNLQSYMEAYYTENNTYATATLANLGLTNQSPQGYYVTSITAATATSYTLSAAPQGTQSSDSCGTLTITNTNLKGPNLSCWQ